MERCVGIVKVDLMKNFCYHCGKELDDDAYSCPECGQLTEKGKANIQSAERKITALPAKPNLNPLISIAIVVILIGVAFSGMTFMTDKNGSKDPYHIDYEWSAKGQSFKYTLDIDKDDYTRMMKSDIDRSGTVSSDNYVKVVDGVKTTVNGVKDYIVVDKYIEAMAKDLKKMCEEYNKKTTVSNRVGYAQFISWFVQSAIDYETDSKFKGVDEYWKYPLETLYDRKGDCEDGAILLAALLYAAGYDAGIYLLPGHSVAAVSMKSIIKMDITEIGKYEYQKRYQGYYPIETAYGAHTTTSDIGEISNLYLNCYFHLYTGYSKTYYISKPNSNTSWVDLNL